MGILTEPNPRSPQPVRHPGAWTPGGDRTDRGAEYGAPAAGTAAPVVFGPQRPVQRAGDAGHDEAAPSLGDIVGPAPAIGVHR